MASHQMESDSKINDDKTVITISGETLLWRRFLSGLVNGFPNEAVEWKRSFGRVTKTVTLEANFVPFDAEKVLISEQNDRKLRNIPILHTFWIECQDLDSYKAYAKEEILNWMLMLRKCGISNDWMIIIVESSDSKKTNKLLPRTSVLDKVKADTATKQPERCISLIDPTRNDSRAAESWQNLLHRMRLLTLQGYNRILGRFEDNMRSQRERRNEFNWSFCEYFLLQEELAFVYEKMGIYDEALVQYDELDALFTQFVLNSNVTECPEWLQNFQSKSSHWSGLSMSDQVHKMLRDSMKKKNLSLLDLRNYLFSRQCSLLLKVHKPWEMAKRSLPFLHNCVQEISILEIKYPEGSVACWIFLCCLEILMTCERYSDSSNKIQYYCLFTASLWAYAREKLMELGELCGLMPSMTPNSEQLHKFVELSSGISNYEDLQDTTDHKAINIIPGGKSNLRPVQRLKEALSSKENFQKHYLELSELAISTFKHIGRIRSARFIGIDLANFYLLLEQIPQAVTFLLDALKTFQVEGWTYLELKTLKEIANCYRKLNEQEKLIRTLLKTITFLEEQSNEERIEIFNEITSLAYQIGADSKICCDGQDHIRFQSAILSTNDKSGSIIPGSHVTYEISLESRIPCDVECEDVSIFLQFSPPKRKITPQKSSSFEGPNSGGKKLATPPKKSSIDSGSLSPNKSGVDSLGFCDNGVPKLLIEEHLDFKQDKSLSSVRIVCKNSAQILRRKDSSGIILKDSVPNVENNKFLLQPLEGTKVIFKPGSNKFHMKTLAGDVGMYVPKQLVIKMSRVQLVTNLDTVGAAASLCEPFSVVHEIPNISVSKETSNQDFPSAFISGSNERVKFSLFTGSCLLKETIALSLRCSKGLKGQQKANGTEMEDLSQEFRVSLPSGNAFQTIESQLILRAEIPAPPHGSGNFAPSGVAYKELMLPSTSFKLTVSDMWNEPREDYIIPMHFVSPFMIAYRVNTSQEKKFIDIRLQHNAEKISGRSQKVLFRFKDPQLEFSNKDWDKLFNLTRINSFANISELSVDQNCTFLYQLKMSDEGKKNPNKFPDVLKLKFKVYYSARDEDADGQAQTWDSVTVYPEIKDYQTLYSLSSRVSPAKGGEVCRAATICSLTLELSRLHKGATESIMYEVLADQAVWAVCGRAAAVVDMSLTKTQTIVVEVMPLVGGHLLLPKIRLSRYIPAQGSTRITDSTLPDPIFKEMKDGAIFLV